MDSIAEFRDLAARFHREILDCDADVDRFRNAARETSEKIASDLPKIAEQFEKDHKESRVLNSFFVKSKQPKDKSNIVFDELTATNQSLVNATGLIGEIREKDQSLFRNVQKQVEEIVKILDFIQEIESISDGVELLSYNSGFVASRAGASGAAFTFIAHEIKELARKTKGLVKRMQKRIDDMLINGEAFNTIVEALNRETDARMDRIQKKLNSVFLNFSENVRGKAGRLLHRLGSEGEQKGHLTSVMATLREQDVIQQSFDTVSRLNREMLGLLEQAAGYNATSSGQADALRQIETASAKLTVLSKMSSELLTALLQKLDTATHTLHGKLQALHGSIQEKEADRNVIISALCDNGDQSDGAGTRKLPIIREFTDIMDELLEFVQYSISEKQNASKHGQQLIDQLTYLEACFEELRMIIKRFSLIKVASKMEIAREDALSKNISASSTMFDELTLRMEELTIQVRKQIIQSTRKMINALENMDLQLREQRDQIESIAMKIQASIGNLYDLEETLNLSLHLIGASSSNLFELIDHSLQDTEDLKLVLQHSQGLVRKYERVRRALDSYRGRLAAAGVAEFELAPDDHRFPEFEACVKSIPGRTDRQSAGTASESENITGATALF